MITCLDTCIVDMPEETVTLLWRGTMEIADHEHSRITHMLICQEPLTAPLEIGDYADLMANKIEGSTISRPEGPTPEETQAKIDGLNAEGKERILAMLKKGKADPAIIAKIEQQPDMNGTMEVVTEWIEELKKGLPNVPDVEGV